MGGAGGAPAAETPAPSPGPVRARSAFSFHPRSPPHISREPPLASGCQRRSGLVTKELFFLLLTAEQTHVRSLSLLRFEPGELSEETQAAGSHLLHGLLSPPAPATPGGGGCPAAGFPLLSWDL